MNVIVCSICNSNLDEGENIYDLNCKHLFHSNCLKPWLLKKSTCPLCRYEIKL
jgi:hypothetical protein